MKVKEFLRPFTGGSVFELNGELHTAYEIVSVYSDFEVFKVNASPDVTHPVLILDEPTCDSYEVTKERHYLTEYEKGYYYGKQGKELIYITKEVSRCKSTKEKEECSCHGYKSQCNLYRRKFMEELTKNEH